VFLFAVLHGFEFACDVLFMNNLLLLNYAEIIIQDDYE